MGLKPIALFAGVLAGCLMAAPADTPRTEDRFALVLENEISSPRRDGEFVEVVSPNKINASGRAGYSPVSFLALRSSDGGIQLQDSFEGHSTILRWAKIGERTVLALNYSAGGNAFLLQLYELNSTGLRRFNGPCFHSNTRLIDLTTDGVAATELEYDDGKSIWVTEWYRLDGLTPVLLRTTRLDLSLLPPSAIAPRPESPPRLGRELPFELVVEQTAALPGATTALAAIARLQRLDPAGPVTLDRVLLHVLANAERDLWPFLVDRIHGRSASLRLIREGSQTTLAVDSVANNAEKLSRLYTLTRLHEGGNALLAPTDGTPALHSGP